MSWNNVKSNTVDPFAHDPSKATARSKKPRKIPLKKFPATIEWLKVCDRTTDFPFKEGADGNTDRMFYTKRDKVLIAAGLYNEESKGKRLVSLMISVDIAAELTC